MSEDRENFEKKFRRKRAFKERKREGNVGSPKQKGKYKRSKSNNREFY